MLKGATRCDQAYHSFHVLITPRSPNPKPKPIHRPHLPLSGSCVLSSKCKEKCQFLPAYSNCNLQDLPFFPLCFFLSFKASTKAVGSHSVEKKTRHFPCLRAPGFKGGKTLQATTSHERRCCWAADGKIAVGEDEGEYVEFQQGKMSLFCLSLLPPPLLSFMSCLLGCNVTPTFYSLPTSLHTGSDMRT